MRGPAPISAALCRYAGPSSRDGGNAARAFSGSAAAPLSRASAHPLEHGLAGRAVQQVYHVDFFNQEGDKAAEADSWRFRTERDHAREQGSKYREVRAREPRRCTPGGNPRGVQTVCAGRSARLVLEPGHEPAGGSPEELAAFARSERSKWEPLIAGAGLKAD